MELDVRDRITAEPTSADVVRAVDERGSDPDWYISLSDADLYLGAMPEGTTLFRLSYRVGEASFDAAETVDAEALKALLLDCLNGGTHWQDGREWELMPPAKRGASAVPTGGSALPFWVVGVAFGASGLVTFLLMMPNGWRESLPFMSSTSGAAVLIFLPMAVLLVAVIANKVLQLGRAAKWPRVSGTIKRCEMKVVRRASGNRPGVARSEPVVEYDFSVGGTRYRGDRISVWDDSGGANLEATLARYPVGGRVTVSYDPTNPRNCVLERDTPGGMASGCLWNLAALVALAVFAALLFIFGGAFLRQVSPDANVEVTLCATGLGASVFVAFIRDRLYLKAADSWPVTTGKVVSSTVKMRETIEDRRVRRTHTAVVEYAYEVKGRRLRSQQIKLGLEISGSRSYAEKITRRYPQGRAVEVHYDPANPSDAALEQSKGWNWILLAFAAVCFWIALHASGLWA